MATAYLSLGANLGHRQYNLARAVELLAPKVYVEQISSLYETEPWGYRDQPRFLNAALMVTTSLSPDGLLTLAQGIEATLGREVSFPNGPRLIDIDILFYDKQVIKTPRLVIPHPRLEERAFVLIPLAEIAPELVHPINQMTVSQLARRIRGQEKVEKMGKLELV